MSYQRRPPRTDPSSRTSTLDGRPAPSPYEQSCRGGDRRASRSTEHRGRAMTSRPAKTSRGSALTTAQSATTSVAGRAKMQVPDIVTFVTHPSFLDLRISVAQETLLRGIYGEPLADEEQRDIWRLCTEREYPAHAFSEVTVISGA